ncbi:MAG: response regulator transcription factor [Planctomycetota bacterium]
MRILAVEDDAKIARFIQQGLESEGHQVDVAGDGGRGLELASSGRYDLILLDLMLPRLDGLDLLRQVRATDATVPVIAVTARDGVEDRVHGLDLGADDYLVKPFSFVELMARIRALFRRTSQPLARHLEQGDLTLDRIARVVRCGGAEVELSAREYQLLEYLMRHPDEPQTRASLADRVWGYQFDTGTNVVDVYVSYVRAKLKQVGLSPIRTLRGIGYVFESGPCRADA